MFHLPPPPQRLSGQDGSSWHTAIFFTTGTFSTLLNLVGETVVETTGGWRKLREAGENICIWSVARHQVPLAAKVRTQMCPFEAAGLPATTPDTGHLPVENDACRWPGVTPLLQPCSSSKPELGSTPSSLGSSTQVRPCPSGNPLPG